jgi:lysine-specific demethylase 8
VHAEVLGAGFWLQKQQQDSKARPRERARLSRLCDLALMLGHPQTHPALHILLAKLAPPALPTQERQADRLLGMELPVVPALGQHGRRLGEVRLPALMTFVNNHMRTATPVVLLGVLDHWPALRKWRNLNFWRDDLGHRVVPVEIGRSYTDGQWTQQLMPLRTFCDRFLRGPVLEAKDRGYLAQHELFQQIPGLARDIIAPDYCFAQLPGEDAETKQQLATNIWLGPANTVSPLHYDPGHNLLCQVFGSKLIRLYAPHETVNLYPRTDSLLHNTSQIDVEQLDSTKFPKAVGVPYFEVVLQAGQALYIPPKYWHYVRSLSDSCSVSFWF